jgi:hypothetical protein
MKLRIRCALCLVVLIYGRAVFGQQPVIISDFSPNVGSPGDNIVISGSGFTSGLTAVLFYNNIPATSAFIASDSQINVTVPPGISTGPLSVITSSGSQIFSSGDFTAIGPGPYISSLVPSIGAVADNISIIGVHFAGVSTVSFNGVNVTIPPAVNSAGTQITSVYVPAGATTGPVSVTTPLGTSNSPSPFTIIGPGPYISAFAPTAGNAGTVVNIIGRFFTGTTSVQFNGVNAAFSSTTDTSIAAIAPANVSTGPITVTTPAGTFTTTNNYFFAPPTLSSFSPVAGRAGTNVQIVGTSLLGVTAVNFNGTASPNFTLVSNTNLVATVPTGVTTGPIRVIAAPFSAITTSNFTVRPTVYGFSPIFGAVGSSIIITGANFNVGTPLVRFNGIQAATPSGVTNSQLTAVVPAGATTGPISVTTTDGSDTNANNFFLPASIASFAPTNTAPGTRVSLSGQNFIGATTVQFGGVAATFNVTNNTSLGATVPTNVLTGHLTVTTPAGTATSTGLFYGAPVISGFTPTHGLPGTAVTLNGVNFFGTTAVQFDGLAAQITSMNNTQLVATVPSGAQSGPITVVAPAARNTSAQPFILDYTSDLAVTITNSPSPVIIGSNLLYTVTVLNNGPYPAPNVQVTNTLPSSVELTSADMTGAWTLATNGNVLTASIANFGAGASATLVISVIPLAPGNIIDTVSVSGGNPDPVPANNVASVVTTVEPLPVLSVALTGNQVKISWSVALSNFVLQSRANLASGVSWSGVTSTPVIAGGTKSVTETNNGSAKYYRLKQ